MKRFVCLMCVLVMLFSACGAEHVPEEVKSYVPSAVQVDEVGAYQIPQTWHTVSIDDGTWGYVTSEMTLPVKGNAAISRDRIIVEATEGDLVTFIRFTTTGEEIDRVTVPLSASEENGSTYISAYAFGEDALWFIEDTYVVIDEETGEMQGSCRLKKYTLAGESRCDIMLDEAYLGTEDGLIIGLSLTPEGDPVLQNLNALVFCDGAGQIVKTTEANPETGFVTDADGRTYLWDSFENTVSTVDYSAGAAGDVVLNVDSNETVLPGGAGYDLLLKSDLKLRGVSFGDGTITEILSWEDMDLAAMVGGVAALEEGSFLISTYDLLLERTQLLLLTRVPVSEIPEKRVVTMAVALHPNLAEAGCTWADVVDQAIAMQLASFNRGNDTYRVEVVTYSSAEELQLQMLTGDSPDILCWDNGLDEMPSLELYAKKGYLVELTPLFEQDETLNLSDFIPSVLELATERTDGLYAMPTNFYLHSWMAPIEYVGDAPDWNFGTMLEVARNLPEDMDLFHYVTRAECIEMMLESAEGMFVDVTAGTCDFSNQEFYDLLTIARDYCPESPKDDAYENPRGTMLLEGCGVFGRLGQFASDTLRPARASGKVFVGYPGDTGNGFTMIFGSEFSICTTGKEQEGAWAFIRNLFDETYQSARLPMCAVRTDCFEAREDWYLEVNGSCTEAESLEARQLVYGAKNLRNYTSPIIPIVQEEAGAFFSGDKTAEEVAAIIENRVKIYLSEQS